jgi:hypothetical protein
VTAVQVAGGLPEAPGTRGYADLELHWRDRLFAYRAEVLEARPLKAAPADDNLPVVRAGVVDALSSTRPDLHVVTLPSDTRPSFTGSLFGWQLPRWLACASLIVGVTTLGLLVAGPQPWRATRWAWF